MAVLEVEIFFVSDLGKFDTNQLFSVNYEMKRTDGCVKIK